MLKLGKWDKSTLGDVEVVVLLVKEGFCGRAPRAYQQSKGIHTYVMEIPGYQWDEKRKRYFKVLKSGELPHSQYTVSALAAQERSELRDLARSRSAQFETTEPDPTSVFDASVVNRKPRILYSGGPNELISTFYFRDNNELMTGSRDGTLSYSGYKSRPGRSIVQLGLFKDDFLVSTVDDGCGTFVSTSRSDCLKLKQQFITSIDTIGDNVLLGSQCGCTVWNPEANLRKVIKLPSVSALGKSSEHTALVGTKSGRLISIDLRKPNKKGNSATTNSRTITNIGLAGMSAIVTSLEDKMLLYDMRKLTVPVLQYSEYENWSTSTHGFALNPAKTAVCVALESGKCRLYDISSGVVLNTIGKSSKYVVPKIQWEDGKMFLAHANKVMVLPGLRLTLASADQDRLEGVSEMYHRLNAPLDNSADAS